MLQKVFVDIRDHSEATSSFLLESSSLSILTEPSFFRLATKEDSTYSLLPCHGKFCSHCYVNDKLQPFFRFNLPEHLHFQTKRILFKREKAILPKKTSSVVSILLPVHRSILAIMFTLLKRHFAQQA